MRPVRRAARTTMSAALALVMTMTTLTTFAAPAGATTADDLRDGMRSAISRLIDKSNAGHELTALTDCVGARAAEAVDRGVGGLTSDEIKQRAASETVTCMNEFRCPANAWPEFLDNHQSFDAARAQLDTNRGAVAQNSGTYFGSAGDLRFIPLEYALASYVHLRGQLDLGERYYPSYTSYVEGAWRCATDGDPVGPNPPSGPPVDPDPPSCATKEEAERIAFLSNKKFLEYLDSADRCEDFNYYTEGSWGTDCSVPPALITERPIARRFNTACTQHDWGYYQFGWFTANDGLAFDPSNEMRKRIDQRFLSSMREICKKEFRRGAGWRVRRANCFKDAKIFYLAVRAGGAGGYEQRYPPAEVNNYWVF